MGKDVVPHTRRVYISYASHDRLAAVKIAEALDAQGLDVWYDDWALRPRGARMQAEGLLAELDVLQELRPKAKAAMIAKARRQPGWKILRTIPFLGPLKSVTA